MSPREATRFLFWASEKQLAGDALTGEELDLLIEARQVSIDMARKYMRLKPEDWAYTKGVPYSELA